jgi:mRNA interferase MazF
MMRGEIWMVAGGTGYAGKPRPALIVQADWLTAEVESVLTCGITSLMQENMLSRPALVPSTDNGLRGPSQVMADKIIAVPRDKLGFRIGAVSGADMARVEQAMLLVLGFGG